MLQFKQLIGWAIFFCTIISLSYLSIIFWQSDQLAVKARNGQLSADSLKPLNAAENFFHAPLNEILHKASSEVGVNNQLLLEIAKEYIERRPLDSNGWLWASLFAQRTDLDSLAESYLTVAHSLSVNNTHQLIKVFNRYLEIGKVEEVMPVAHDISFIRPEEFRKIFYLLTRLNSNYDDVINSVIPKTVNNSRLRKVYPQDVYYSWALNDAMRAKNDALASSVWSAIPNEYKLDSEYGLRYLGYLSLQQNKSQLAPVWLEQVGSAMPVGNFPKQKIGSANNPCWHSRSTDQDSVKIEALTDFDTAGLKLSFLGTDNVNYSDLSCAIAVESGQQYVLSAQWSGEGITTLSGPFIDVFAPSVQAKEFYSRNDDMIGSWLWSDIEVDFTVPQNVEIINVRIRRRETDYLDSKISGQVSFRDFKLTAIETDLNNDLSNAVSTSILQ